MYWFRIYEFSRNFTRFAKLRQIFHEKQGFARNNMRANIFKISRVRNFIVAKINTEGENECHYGISVHACTRNTSNLTFQVKNIPAVIAYTLGGNSSGKIICHQAEISSLFHLIMYIFVIQRTQ